MSSLVVVAINIGTTHSGYAFSTRHDYMRDHQKISIPAWPSYSGLCPPLTSSCILFDAAGDFHSFGFEAEEKYADLTLENKHQDWYYFKMICEKMEPTLGSLTEDDKGKKMESIKVFAGAILYLKSHFLKTLAQRMYAIDISDISWVLTVPAIWNDSSKLFATEAAKEAGISKDKLFIVREPEAASWTCMRIPNEEKCESSSFEGLISGSKYIVVNVGDPRTDITFHEVQGDGTLKDLCQAQDNHQGGNNLVSSFMNLISDLLGNDVISAFNSEYKFDSQELQNDFKIRMKAMKPDCVDNITFRVPMSLIEIICKFNPNKEKVLTLDARFKEQATVIGNKLRINAELLKTVFDKSYERTFRDVHQLLRHPSMRGITSILLVGEFAVYPMLHKVVKQIFPDKRVIVPPNPDFAVLKGAVIYGHFFN
ncbi:heat shock 70 kDa protein 12A-like isoform X2 [Crassostrea virginica]|uniref:Heat shock 70 kDa protein 12A-like n=1 Tax=Crassostrea virginica TaxID=6565 RepID=A0A8B8A7U9_CRAVI|nr:heat shock 70 kDa protein 12A-like [Crassostrea virginica]XP_022287524.1 heat shock 70 kDa protein 12A-like [Crassostrea virginica]XP_022287525.1 heat shock 70 kDa protein 12A-like [Crassostrea virginica]XP_022287526.1 heat shock 70 kDa protein 12A-like [Crassostrea virginica]XP_022287527.1 heat shock 70 kDa protein 12A-like [Crassostrea virginica]